MSSNEKDVFLAYRQKAERQEELSQYQRASLSSQHSRLQKEDNDHRLAYKRDVDRIIHSKAYARYSDKTQVAYLIANDHITQRSLHVQLVSSFARGIAEILRLNLDLVEAIALGHDVGHPPFGHEGEGYLSKISVKLQGIPFAHPWQSCRLFSAIEPLNLGLAVYDGFLCHDGGMSGTILKPRLGKTWEDHLADKKQKLVDPDGNIMPGTLEGCLVKLCDTMSYLGRDIEDAISLGILERKDVVKTYLGITNRDILGVLARDMIKHSYDCDYIAISEEAFDALKKLRQFNFERIYNHIKLKGESSKIQRSYRILFELLLEGFEIDQEESYIWRHFLHNKTEAYLNETTRIQMVVDYISGMTDSYFVRTLETLIVPKSIELL